MRRVEFTLQRCVAHLSTAWLTRSGYERLSALAHSALWELPVKARHSCMQTVDKPIVILNPCNENTHL